MKKGMMATALLVALSMGGGCSLWPFGSSKDPAKDMPPAEPAQEAAAIPEPAPAPAPVAKGKKGKVQKEAPAPKGKAVVESQEVIQQKLDVVGHKLVRDAAANVTPRMSNKEVTKDTEGYVAKYITVDVNSLKTEVLPSSSGNATQRVGSVKYVEQVYECRGKTKADALKAPCSIVKNRRMNELIRYENGKWAL